MINSFYQNYKTYEPLKDIIVMNGKKYMMNGKNVNYKKKILNLAVWD